VVYPLVAAYALYALLARPHRSWWSWFIHSLAHWVYAFQFLGMTPQLFVNYKLKSVAHMPWRPLMYKAFNTFIDDVFAWIIEMPLGHRIACLRDDVVFFVYLYQRYIYRVDKSRPNEFGIAYEKPSASSSVSCSRSSSGAAGTAPPPQNLAEKALEKFLEEERASKEKRRGAKLQVVYQGERHVPSSDGPLSDGAKGGGFVRARRRKQSGTAASP